MTMRERFLDVVADALDRDPTSQSYSPRSTSRGCDCARGHAATPSASSTSAFASS